MKTILLVSVVVLVGLSGRVYGQDSPLCTEDNCPSGCVELGLTVAECTCPLDMKECRDMYSVVCVELAEQCPECPGFACPPDISGAEVCVSDPSECPCPEGTIKCPLEAGGFYCVDNQDGMATCSAPCPGVLCPRLKDEYGMPIGEERCVLDPHDCECPEGYLHCTGDFEGFMCVDNSDGMATCEMGCPGFVCPRLLDEFGNPIGEERCVADPHDCECPVGFTFCEGYGVDGFWCVPEGQPCTIACPGFICPRLLDEFGNPIGEERCVADPHDCQCPDDYLYCPNEPTGFYCVENLDGQATCSLICPDFACPRPMDEYGQPIGEIRCVTDPTECECPPQFLYCVDEGVGGFFCIPNFSGTATCADGCPGFVCPSTTEDPEDVRCVANPFMCECPPELPVPCVYGEGFFCTAEGSECPSAKSVVVVDSGAGLVEVGSVDTYTYNIFLTSPPSHDVTINLSLSVEGGVVDPAVLAVVEPSQLVFTPGDSFAVRKPVTIRLVATTEPQRTPLQLLVGHDVESGDDGYDDSPVADVPVRYVNPIGPPLVVEILQDTPDIVIPGERFTVLTQMSNLSPDCVPTGNLELFVSLGANMELAGPTTDPFSFDVTTSPATPDVNFSVRQEGANTYALTVDQVLLSSQHPNCLVSREVIVNGVIVSFEGQVPLGATGVMGAAVISAEGNETASSPIETLSSVINPAGMVFHDPHFTGFFGGNYDVHGEPGKVFNLLSDRRIQVNARFIAYPHVFPDGTFLGEVGILAGRSDQRMHISSNGTVTVFNEVLPPNVVRHLQGQDATLTVKYDGYIVNVTRYTQPVRMGRQFVDFLGVIIGFAGNKASPEHNPHGLIGQTARDLHGVRGVGQQGEGVIEGTYHDYIEAHDDLFGSSFKFNRFEGKSRGDRS